MYARMASAPATASSRRTTPGAVGPAGRVEPRHERHAERHRPVRVVQLVGGTPVVGEQQEPDRDLRDEQRLREREQMRRHRSRAAAAPVEVPARERRAGAHGDHRDAEPWMQRRHAARVAERRRTSERHPSSITIVPANEASWEDLQAVFGTRGDPSRCYCQRYKMQPGESWASVGAEELAFRLRTQTDCGHPESGTTSGLVAYLDGEPVGWCAVEPRTAYPRLLLKTRVPWDGRAEDKTDESVWAVTCFVTRTGFRRRGVSRALARAAVDFARDRGARALEGYPMITEPGQEIMPGRAPRRQPQHLRRRRVRRGQSSDPPPGRDAHRFLGGRLTPRGMHPKDDTSVNV